MSIVSVVSVMQMQIDALRTERDKARAALDALEKQEPVAYFDVQENRFYFALPTFFHVPNSIKIDPIKFYTSPIPATTPEIEALRAEVEEYRSDKLAGFDRLFEAMGDDPEDPFDRKWSTICLYIENARAEIKRLKLMEESSLKVCAQLNEVVSALPCDYLDPPDGGDVSLGEQVKRMYSEVTQLRAQLAVQKEYYEGVFKDGERQIAKWKETAEMHKENYDVLLGDLRMKLATAQQDVAEACAKVCDPVSVGNNVIKATMTQMARRIRAGKWKEFLK